MKFAYTIVYVPDVAASLQFLKTPSVSIGVSCTNQAPMANLKQVAPPCLSQPMSWAR